jgi:hypothetical protein
MVRAQQAHDDSLQSLYMLAILDLPPGVEPTLIERLLYLYGRSEQPPGLGIVTTKPVDKREPITAFRIELGRPSPSVPELVYHATEPIAHLDGYRVELFGTAFRETIPGLPVPPERIWEITLRRADGEVFPFDFLAWRQRAYLGETGRYAELRWHPGLEDDHIRFGGLDASNDQRTMRRLNAAIALLRRTARSWDSQPGRKARIIAGLDPETSRARFREILRLKRASYSHSQIAVRFNSSKSTVSDWLRMAKEAEDEGELN